MAKPPLSGSGLCDPLKHGHAQPGHPVEHLAADLGLHLLVNQTLGAKAPTDDRLVSVDCGFYPGTPIVPRASLPGYPALLS
jgi:hypothetical protein